MADSFAESMGLVPHHKMKEHNMPRVMLEKKTSGATLESLLTFKNMDINMT